jgi:pimeloyl-ACP methyl ester carboxylesterase
MANLEWELTLQRGKPITILVHGFQHDPRQADAQNPHLTIFKEPSRTTPRSWAADLGYFEPGADVCLALGWFSKPVFNWFELVFLGRNFYKVAYRWAEWAAKHLLDMLLTLPPDRPINLVCHSLGSRVVLRALHDVAEICGRRDSGPCPRVEKVIMLGAAEYQDEAHDIPDLWPNTSFYNIANRHDWILNDFAENFGLKSDDVLGHNGLGFFAPNWVDVYLDKPEVERHLGFALTPGERPHENYYENIDLMRWYRQILQSKDLSLAPKALVGGGLPTFVVDGD